MEEGLMWVSGDDPGQGREFFHRAGYCTRGVISAALKSFLA